MLTSVGRLGAHFTLFANFQTQLQSLITIREPLRFLYSASRPRPV